MAWSSYRRFLHAHPLKTKALTSSFITGLADVGLQLYEQNSNKLGVVEKHHQQPELDIASTLSGGQDTCRNVRVASGFWHFSQLEWSRTLTLAAVGLLYSGPVGHLWFNTLEKLVRTQHQVLSVTLKLLIDQLMYAPVAISGYLVVRSILEGRSGPQIRAKLEEKVVPATQAAWQFWPFVNLVSFSVVPVIYRVLFGNACAIYWNARLSAISTEDIVVRHPDQTVARVDEPVRKSSPEPLSSILSVRARWQLAIGNLAIDAPMDNMKATLAFGNLGTHIGFGTFMTAFMEELLEQAIREASS